MLPDLASLPYTTKDTIHDYVRKVNALDWNNRAQNGVVTDARKISILTADLPRDCDTIGQIHWCNFNRYASKPVHHVHLLKITTLY